MTADSADGFSKDLPFAREVAKHLDLKLEVIKVEADSMAKDLEKMVLPLDEPLADPAALNAFYISRQARKMDTKFCFQVLAGMTSSLAIDAIRQRWKSIGRVPQSVKKQWNLQSYKLD